MPEASDVPAPTPPRGLTMRDVVALTAVPALVLVLAGWYHASDGFPRRAPFDGFVPLLTALSAIGAAVSLALAVEVVRLRSVLAARPPAPRAPAGSVISMAEGGY